MPDAQLLIAPLEGGVCSAPGVAGALWLLGRAGGGGGELGSCQQLPPSPFSAPAPSTPAHRALHCLVEHARTQHSPRLWSAQETRMVSQPKGPNFPFQYSRPPKIYFFPWSPHDGLYTSVLSLSVLLLHCIEETRWAMGQNPSSNLGLITYYLVTLGRWANALALVSWSLNWRIITSASNPKRWCCWSSVLNMPANLENSATGLEKVSFHSNPKKRQCQRMFKLHTIALILYDSKVILKILQGRLQ